MRSREETNLPQRKSKRSKTCRRSYRSRGIVGLDSGIWKRLLPEERFYIKGVEIEAGRTRRAGEPASVLLARIKAERERNKSENPPLRQTRKARTKKAAA